MKTRELCENAILVATLTAGKTALAGLANIEIVTALLTVYALVFGWRRTVMVCLVFVLLESFIWGFGWWVLLYLIYWPALVTAVSILPKFKFRTVAAICIGVAFTALFGVLSTAIDIVLAGGIGHSFWQLFYFRYIAGTSFFITHIVSNAMILPLLVPVLYRALKSYGKTNYEKRP